MSFIHHLFLFSSWGPVLNLVFPLILFVFFVVDFSLLLAPRRKKMSDLRLGPAFFSFFFPLRYAAGQDLRDVNGISFPSSSLNQSSNMQMLSHSYIEWWREKTRVFHSTYGYPRSRSFQIHKWSVFQEERRIWKALRSVICLTLPLIHSLIWGQHKRIKEWKRRPQNQWISESLITFPFIFQRNSIDRKGDFLYFFISNIFYLSQHLFNQNIFL